MAAAHGHEALIGAGTVLTTDEVRAVHDAGGRLIVSPNTDAQGIAATVALGMKSWTGALTPSECFAAIAAGASGLKIFPAFLMGIDGLKALRAVLPADCPVYIVGGVGPANFGDWLKAGANGFGLGTSLYTPGTTIDEIAERAQATVAAWDEAAA